MLFKFYLHWQWKLVLYFKSKTKKEQLKQWNEATTVKMKGVVSKETVVLRRWGSSHDTKIWLSEVKSKNMLLYDWKAMVKKFRKFYKNLFRLSLKNLGSYAWVFTVVYKDLVLSTELIMWIGHRTEILKADVSSVSPSSERIPNRSGEGLTLETSAFRISVRWPIYIINSVDKTKSLYTTVETHA